MIVKNPSTDDGLISDSAPIPEKVPGTAVTVGWKLGYDHWFYRLVRSGWWPRGPLYLMIWFWVFFAAPVLLFNINMGPWQDWSHGHLLTGSFLAQAGACATHTKGFWCNGGVIGDLTVLPAVHLGPLTLGPFTTDRRNAAIFAIYTLWWGSIAFAMIFLGRIWCGNLCPMGALSEFIQTASARLGVKQYGIKNVVRVGWLLPVMFIWITWLTKYLDSEHIPLDTFTTFMGLTMLAIVVGVLLKGRSWCRYL